jgi:hypothetical protein
MRRFEVYLILGMYFGAGALLGYVIGKEKPKRPATVVIDIVKEGDEILLYEHYSGELVFEYNKNKEVDKSAYGSLRMCGRRSKVILYIRLVRMNVVFVNPEISIA